MGVNTYPTPSTGGGGENLGALGGGSLVWSATTTGALAGFTTDFPMAAGAYQFTFGRLTVPSGGELKAFLSKDGQFVTSAVVTSNARMTNTTTSFYVESPGDFDKVELYNGGNAILASSTAGVSLTVVAGRRAVSSTNSYNAPTEIASFPTTTTTSTYALCHYPGYYSSMVWNQAGTKAYYIYTTYPSGSYSTNTFAPEFYEYDVATNTHTKKANLGYTNSSFYAAIYHNMFMDSSGRVYVQGGNYWNGASWQNRDDLYRWNPGTNTWSLLTNAGPNGMAYHTFTNFATDIVYFVPWGYNFTTGATDAPFRAYNVGSNTYTTLNSPTGPTYTWASGSYTSRTVSSNSASETPYFYDFARGKLWVSYSSTGTTAYYPVYAEYTFSSNTWTADTAGGTITVAPVAQTNPKYLENGSELSQGVPIEFSGSFYSQKFDGKTAFPSQGVANTVSISGVLASADISGTKSPLRNKMVSWRARSTSFPYQFGYTVNSYYYTMDNSTNTFTTPSKFYRLHLTNDVTSYPAYVS